MSGLETLAVAVTLASVWLTVTQVVWCWPLALISVSLYGVLFYQARLFADMGLQGFYFVLSAYGWWAWLHGGEDQGQLQVSRLSLRRGILLFLLAAGFAVALGSTLSRWTQASFPYLDSTLTAFSLVAQWLMTRKILENWLVWIAVDVVYVGLFTVKQLYLTAGLYGLFLAMAAAGLIQWRRSMDASQPTLQTEVTS